MKHLEDNKIKVVLIILLIVAKFKLEYILHADLNLSSDSAEKTANVNQILTPFY